MVSTVSWRELRPRRIERRGKDWEIWRVLDREYSVDIELWPINGRTDGAAAAMTPNVASSLGLDLSIGSLPSENHALITYTAHLKRSTRSPR